jgi:Zn-ribbon protein, possibly nucleic acid-binding
MGHKIQEAVTVVDQLRVLYHLQLIDSRIDEIRRFRVNIPIEIGSLEDELDQMKKKFQNLHEDILYIKENINKQDKNLKSSEILISKYENQKDHIKNHKELYSLDKEIDYQKLEIQLSKKKIKELNVQITNKQEILEKKEYVLKNKEEHLCHKKKELNHILLENKKEEKILLEQFLYFSKKVDDNLLKTYKKIRNGVKNGVAVAPVQRGAPLGSYLAITPQKYSELIQRNKLLIDEHSGRILIDAELAEEEKKKSFVFCYKKKKL